MWCLAKKSAMLKNFYIFVVWQKIIHSKLIICAPIHFTNFRLCSLLLEPHIIKYILPDYIVFVENLALFLSPIALFCPFSIFYSDVFWLMRCLCCYTHVQVVFRNTLRTISTETLLLRLHSIINCLTVLDCLSYLLSKFCDLLHLKHFILYV